MANLVVFDMDGTLNKTDEYAVEAYQLALRQVGAPALSEAEIIRQLGKRPDDIADSILPKGSGASERESYFKHLRENEYLLIRKNGKAFDGILELLRNLHQAGICTAVCSNASRGHIDKVLHAIKIADQIDEVQSLIPGKTKVEVLRALLGRLHPEKTCMVGDRIFDREAASENHVPFIGCLYGYGPSEIRDAEFTVSAPSEIYPLVIHLFGSNKAQRGKKKE